jgi:hypothetical protein
LTSYCKLPKQFCVQCAMQQPHPTAVHTDAFSCKQIGTQDLV